MVTRGMDNYVIMDMLYMKNNPVSYKHVRKDVKLKYYVRLYNYLERLDIKSIKDNTFTIGDSYDIPNLVNRLDELRLYFEEYEQYERCSVIKSTIDMLYYESTKNKPLNELSI
jgi:hypothetical protein